MSPATKAVHPGTDLDEKSLDVGCDSLLTQVAGGDHAAFATLYDRCVPVVYGIALRLLRDDAHAQEVTQEVLLEVWQRAHRFDAASGSGWAWITLLAHSRTVDRIRSVQRARVRDSRQYDLDSWRSVPSAADVAMRRLESSRVRDALAVCTPHQREAIELAYFGGHTYRRVSELLGIPCCTAKSRIRDGMIRLRTHLVQSN